MDGLIYLDYYASTPLDAAVSNEMIKALEVNGFCNPSSTHRLGKIAKTAVSNNRFHIAHLINAHPSDIMFCSGGSESINTALKYVYICVI